MTGGRIPSLDGLRALSIALVLFAHTSGTRFFPSFVLARRDMGNLGVRVFFVISGFLITSLLLEELEKTGKI
jgi:peptidoglycan/LPS O-acetylase OafA/YrhL